MGETVAFYSFINERACSVVPQNSQRALDLGLFMQTAGLHPRPPPPHNAASWSIFLGPHSRLPGLSGLWMCCGVQSPRRPLPCACSLSVGFVASISPMLFLGMFRQQPQTFFFN